MALQTIAHWLQQVRFLQAVLMGGLLGVGFLAPAFWWLSLGSVIWMIQAVLQSVSGRKLTWLFFVIWTIKALCSIGWVWSTYPIDWVGGLSESTQLVLIFMYWLSSAVWLGLGGMMFALLCLGVKRQFPLRPHVLLVVMPFAWLLAEVAGALSFSFFTSGIGSSLQAYFSFSMIGYLLATTPLGLWLAGFIHVYGLTMVMVMLGLLLYVLCKRTSILMIISSCVIVYVGCVYSNLNGTFVSNNNHFVISVDTQLDARFLSTDEGLIRKAEIIAQAVAASLDLKPDVVVLPEDARYLSSQFNSENVNQSLTAFKFTHGDTQSIVIDSGRYTTPEGRTVLRANVFDVRGDTIWQFDKQYLVPQGEYLPTVHGLVVRLLGHGDALDAIAQDSAYRPGPLVQTSDIPDYVPGVLFCFEGVNPNGVPDLNNIRQLPFVAHPISHAWFHNPTIFWQQLDVMLQVQARYSGISIVSAGNMATGKMYLPNGEIQFGEIVGQGERYTLREFRF